MTVTLVTSAGGTICIRGIAAQFAEHLARIQGELNTIKYGRVVFNFEGDTHFQAETTAVHKGRRWDSTRNIA